MITLSEFKIEVAESMAKGRGEFLEDDTADEYLFDAQNAIDVFQKYVCIQVEGEPPRTGDAVEVKIVDGEDGILYMTECDAFKKVEGKDFIINFMAGDCMELENYEIIKLADGRPCLIMKKECG